MLTYVVENNYDFFRYKFYEKTLDSEIKEVKFGNYYQLFPKLIIICENLTFDIVVT
jgi:hypothetical protein